MQTSELSQERTNDLLELISDQLQLIAAYLATPVAASMADSTMMQPSYLRLLHLQVHEARKHLGIESS